MRTDLNQLSADCGYMVTDFGRTTLLHALVWYRRGINTQGQQLIY